MIDADGDEWLPYTDAARRLRVREDLLRQWASRGKVRKHRTGRTAWVNMPDARAAEADWRKRL